MRAAVADAEHAARRDEHLAQRVEVAVAVPEQRAQQQLVPVVLEQQVVELLHGVDARASARPITLISGGGS